MANLKFLTKKCDLHGLYNNKNSKFSSITQPVYHAIAPVN